VLVVVKYVSICVLFLFAGGGGGGGGGMHPAIVIIVLLETSRLSAFNELVVFWLGGGHSLQLWFVTWVCGMVPLCSVDFGLVSLSLSWQDAA